MPCEYLTAYNRTFESSSGNRIAGGIDHSRALLERLRGEGFAGATVIHGVAGFGASSVIHTTSLVWLSSDLPVLIEIVDNDEHIERLLPILDEMLIGGALVTVERVRVLKYAAAPKRENTEEEKNP